MDVSVGKKELFPIDGFDLASDARKSYYRELVSFAREELLSIPEGYLQHLKSLFFEGGISIDPWVAFRASAPLLICLSAPTASRSFIVSTYDAYELRLAQYDLQLYSINVFGRSRSQWQMVIDRFEFIVECLADNNSRCNSSECGGLRPQYLSLYFKIFYLYRRGGDIKPGFAKNIIEYVERDYEEVQAFEASADTLLAFPKAFAPILSGNIANPESAYSDPILLGFLQRFFTKQLPPKLQVIVEGVYAQVERPIRLVDGRVEY